MNALLLITRYNREAMMAFAQDLAKRQIAPNTGKLLVMGGSYLDDEALQRVGGVLKPAFEVVELTKIQLSEKTSPDSQTATMIATWLMQRYTSVPGPWLVADDKAEIIHDNPLSILEKIHNANNAENTGRATTLGGGRVPVGPVVVGALAKRIKTLRSVSGQNWRQRGRWAFNVCSWHQVDAKEYPFRLVAEVEAPAASADAADKPVPKTQITSGDVKPIEPLKSAASLPVTKGGATSPDITGGTSQATQPVAMSEMYQEGSADELVEKAALGQDKTPQQIYEERLKAEEEGRPKPGDPNYIPPEGSADLTDEEAAAMPQHPGAALEEIDDTPPKIDQGEDLKVEKPADQIRKPRPPAKPFVRVDPDAYQKVTREILIEQVAHRSGRKPHPRTGKTKLIAKLQELDGKAAAAGRQ